MTDLPEPVSSIPFRPATPRRRGAKSVTRGRRREAAAPPRRGVPEGHAHELRTERDAAQRQCPAADRAAERREQEAAHRSRGRYEQPSADRLPATPALIVGIGIATVPGIGRIDEHEQHHWASLSATAGLVKSYGVEFPAANRTARSRSTVHPGHRCPDAERRASQVVARRPAREAALMSLHPSPRRAAPGSRRAASRVTAVDVHAAERPRARRGGRRETFLFRIAIALIALHVLDDNFLQPQPGTAAADHLVSGLVPLCLLGLAGLGVSAPARRPARCARAVDRAARHRRRDRGVPLHARARRLGRRLTPGCSRSPPGSC